MNKEHEFYIALGRAITKAREAKSMSQTDLANALGLVPTVVSRWERAVNKPSAYQLARMREMIDL